MRSILYFLFVVCLFGTVSAQNREVEVQIVNHQVKQGETVRLISKKYLVSPSDIYRLNKFAVDGINQGMVLQIPVPVKETASEPAKEETMPELTTEVDEVQKAMAAVEEDQPKTTPKKDKAKPVADSEEQVVMETATEVSSGSVVEHKVKPGETLNGLAKKYGVTITDLKNSNEKVLKRGLQAGQTLKIPAANGIIPSNEELRDPVAAEPAPKAEEPVRKTEPAVPNTPLSGETIEHKVAHGETLYSISRKYNIPVDELKKQNEKQLARGLQTGQTITITPKN
jgi:LysM repeat protein